MDRSYQQAARQSCRSIADSDDDVPNITVILDGAADAIMDAHPKMANGSCLSQ